MIPERQPTVLITRPLGLGEETRRRLAHVHAVTAPLLRIVPLATRLPDAAGVQAVLVSSANALPGLPASYRATKLLAVGDATARRAEALGFTSVRSAGGDAARLLALTIERTDPDGLPLLLICGRGNGHHLVAQLRSRGRKIHRRAVYESRPVTVLPEPARAALLDGVSAVLFFSPLTSITFARLLPRALPPACLANTEALAISDAAAVALAPLPWRRIRVASQPDQDALLGLLT